MKKGFTLLEMLVVITILAVLMGIVFRLSSIGSNSDKRTKTIMRLQCLENCLSGYYAAFGSYPPVKRHTVPDPFLEVTDFGVQTGDQNEGIFSWSQIGETAEISAWNQVREACLSQPVACNYPFGGDINDDQIRELSETMRDRLNDGEYDDLDPKLTDHERSLIELGFDNGSSGGTGRFSNNRNKTSWNDIRLFRFGLMSYLLPRYLVMLQGAEDFFNFAQWEDNNTKPCSPYGGQPFTSWQVMKTIYDNAMENSTQENRDLAALANIPSQAVCARWMPNLEGQCRTNGSKSLFGVNIAEDSLSLNSQSPRAVLGLLNTPNPQSNDRNNMYILDGISVTDAWGNDFYYHSPTPHQKYTLWSAGPNGRTFPPWISRESNSLQGRAKECIAIWTHDDIVNLSN